MACHPVSASFHEAASLSSISPATAYRWWEKGKEGAQGFQQFHAVIHRAISKREMRGFLSKLEALERGKPLLEELIGSAITQEDFDRIWQRMWWEVTEPDYS